MDKKLVIERTRRWIAAMVIGLNLCPFARRVFEADRIRYVVSDAVDARQLEKELAAELQALAAVPIASVETTLLIHPGALVDFLDYNDFLGVVERRVAKLGLEGVVQVASFHPEHQFADTDAEDVENYTNRSPYPMLHLLREESITAIAEDTNALLAIPQRNIEALRALGRAKILQMLKELED